VTYTLVVIGFTICVLGFIAVLVTLISRLLRGTLFEDEVDTGEWEPIADILEPERNAAGMLENWHKPERGWMQTASGRKFYPLEPSPDDVELVDVAHGLAFTCRYGGHTKRYYSVAEHCVLVSEVIERDARASGMPPDFVRAIALEALLHDSAEAYVGDMVRPLKHQPEMIEFRNAEARIEDCVRAAFKIESTEQSRKVIKIVDDRILVDEITALMPNPGMYLETDTLRGVEPIGVHVMGWSPEMAQRRFIERYRELAG
jgi:5'-nucleotidase